MPQQPQAGIREAVEAGIREPAQQRPRAGIREAARHVEGERHVSAGRAADPLRRGPTRSEAEAPKKQLVSEFDDPVSGLTK